MKKCGFLGGKEAIQSLRSSGYKDTSMAIGELIDNSIQAGATEVLLILTSEKRIGTRNTQRVSSIAVVDNGSGMDSDKLQSALVLGEGTNRYERTGMGKFGVGLPQSSISQAKRIDAWSWIDGMSTCNHAYIDLDDDEWLNDAEIKDPDKTELPSAYARYAKEYNSGTVISWTKTDRINWRKPTTVFQKCENQIGRMYRYWLYKNQIDIKMITLDESGKEIGSNVFQALDPLFLMPGAKCGNPPRTPMFKKFVDPIVREYDLDIEGVTKKVSVEMKFSIAEEDVRILDDESVAGRKDYGKLAKDCMGISIVREGRELDLNNQWNIPDSKDPRHRWWGAEISFNRDLDEVFGVTNNKQSATKLNEMAKKKYDEIMEEMDIDSEGDPDRDKNKLKMESPMDYILMDVVTTVQNIILQMDNNIKNNTRKSKSKKTRHDLNQDVQTKYDVLVENRSKSTSSQTDELIIERGSDRIEKIVAELDLDDRYDNEDKEQIISDVEQGHRCSVIVSPQDSSSFFNVERKDTHMVVKLNSDHIMYDQLFGIFDDILNDEKGNVEDIKIKSKDAFNTIQFLLTAWARMEDEDRDPNMKRRYRNIREKWGSILEDSVINDN